MAVNGIMSSPVLGSGRNPSTYLEKSQVEVRAPQASAKELARRTSTMSTAAEAPSDLAKHKTALEKVGLKRSPSDEVLRQRAVRKAIKKHHKELKKAEKHVTQVLKSLDHAVKIGDVAKEAEERHALRMAELARQVAEDTLQKAAGERRPGEPSPLPTPQQQPIVVEPASPLDTIDALRAPLNGVGMPSPGPVVFDESLDETRGGLVRSLGQPITSPLQSAADRIAEEADRQVGGWDNAIGSNKTDSGNAAGPYYGGASKAASSGPEVVVLTSSSMSSSQSSFQAPSGGILAGGEQRALPPPPASPSFSSKASPFAASPFAASPFAASPVASSPRVPVDAPPRRSGSLPSDEHDRHQVAREIGTNIDRMMESQRSVSPPTVAPHSLPPLDVQNNRLVAQRIRTAAEIVTPRALPTAAEHNRQASKLPRDLEVASKIESLLHRHISRESSRGESEPASKSFGRQESISDAIHSAAEKIDRGEAPLPSASVHNAKPSKLGRGAAANIVQQILQDKAVAHSRIGNSPSIKPRRQRSVADAIRIAAENVDSDSISSATVHNARVGELSSRDDGDGAGSSSPELEHVVTNRERQSLGKKEDNHNNYIARPSGSSPRPGMPPQPSSSSAATERKEAVNDRGTATSDRSRQVPVTGRSGLPSAFEADRPGKDGDQQQKRAGSSSTTVHQGSTFTSSEAAKMVHAARAIQIAAKDNFAYGTGKEPNGSVHNAPVKKLDRKRSAEVEKVVLARLDTLKKEGVVQDCGGSKNGNRQLGRRSDKQSDASADGRLSGDFSLNELGLSDSLKSDRATREPPPPGTQPDHVERQRSSVGEGLRVLMQRLTECGSNLCTAGAEVVENEFHSGGPHLRGGSVDFNAEAGVANGDDMLFR